MPKNDDTGSSNRRDASIPDDVVADLMSRTKSMVSCAEFLCNTSRLTISATRSSLVMGSATSMQGLPVALFQKTLRCRSPMYMMMMMTVGDDWMMGSCNVLMFA